jgi:hypothetical protein
MTTFRVHFPGLTIDLKRDFLDRDEAERFARARQDASGTMWRHVRIEEINQEQPR